MKQKIYSIREVDDYDEGDYDFATTADDIDSLSVYQGYPLSEEWKIPLFTLGKGEFTDFICNDCAWILCSANLKKTITEHIAANTKIEWLPAKVKSGNEVRDYFVCLLTAFFAFDEILNIEKSGKFDDGEIYSPCFDSKKIGKNDIFALEDNGIAVFISERLKAILESQKFSGLGFEKWKSV